MNTVEVFDPATGTWETKAPMLVPRNHLAGGVVNGKIYVMGGRVGSSFVGASSTDAVEEYDPATDTWRVRARMPYPRSGMAFASDGKLIYMAGGEFLNSDMVGVFRNLEAYDPARDLWYELPPMTVRAPRLRRRHHQWRLPHRDRPAPERHRRRRPRRLARARRISDRQTRRIGQQDEINGVGDHYFADNPLKCSAMPSCCCCQRLYVSAQGRRTGRATGRSQGMAPAAAGQAQGDG